MVYVSSAPDTQLSHEMEESVNIPNVTLMKSSSKMDHALNVETTLDLKTMVSNAVRTFAILEKEFKLMGLVQPLPRQHHSAHKTRLQCLMVDVKNAHHIRDLPKTKRSVSHLNVVQTKNY